MQTTIAYNNNIALTEMVTILQFKLNRRLSDKEIDILKWLSNTDQTTHNTILNLFTEMCNNR